MSVKKMVVFLCCIFLLLMSSATATYNVCNRCVYKTAVSYFHDDTALSSGACGYRSLALDFSGGYLAAASASFDDDGFACGQCFQMRCKNKTLCTGKGTEFIVSDIKQDNRTDFVLSRKAFAAMAKKGMEEDILKLGHVDVEYKRVPCKYKNKNLSVRMEESSDPQSLTVTVLYQGGQTDIYMMSLSLVDYTQSLFTRTHGAVWTGYLQGGGNKDLQFQFSIANGSRYDFTWVVGKKLLPANWKPGEIYDTGLQITSVRKSYCFDDSCDHKTWK